MHLSWAQQYTYMSPKQSKNCKKVIVSCDEQLKKLWYDVTQFVCQLFQRCYKGYPRLFSGCFLEFLWCFICVSRVFQRHYKASLINFYPANIRNLAESFWPDTQVPRNTFDFFHLCQDPSDILRFWVLSKSKNKIIKSTSYMISLTFEKLQHLGRVQKYRIINTIMF